MDYHWESDLIIRKVLFLLRHLLHLLLYMNRNVDCDLRNLIFDNHLKQVNLSKVDRMM